MRPPGPPGVRTPPGPSRSARAVRPGPPGRRPAGRGTARADPRPPTRPTPAGPRRTGPGPEQARQGTRCPVRADRRPGRITVAARRAATPGGDQARPRLRLLLPSGQRRRAGAPGPPAARPPGVGRLAGAGGPRHRRDRRPRPAQQRHRRTGRAAGLHRSSDRGVPPFGADQAATAVRHPQRAHRPRHRGPGRPGPPARRTGGPDLADRRTPPGAAHPGRRGPQRDVLPDRHHLRDDPAAVGGSGRPAGGARRRVPAGCRAADVRQLDRR